MKQIITQLTETINTFLQNPMNSLTDEPADWAFDIMTSLDDPFLKSARMKLKHRS